MKGGGAGMVQTEKLVFEYEKRDEEGNVTGTYRAIDEIDLDVKEGQFIAVLEKSTPSPQDCILKVLPTD